MAILFIRCLMAMFITEAALSAFLMLYASGCHALTATKLMVTPFMTVFSLNSAAYEP